jgi:hypothetical protein
MAGVAAAIAGAAVVGAGATMIAGHEASQATQAAANTAADTQKAALAQEKELAAPYTALGQQAIPTLENLLGIAPPGKPGAQAGPTPQQTLESMPGYQFAKTQGIQSTEAAAGGMGMALSGNTLEGISQFTTGLADQTYGAEIDRLMRVAGLGQAAAAGQAANIQTGATNLGNIAQQQGATQAGIAANEAASISGIAGSLGGAALTANTLAGIRGAGGGGAPYTAPTVPYTTPGPIGLPPGASLTDVPAIA